MRQSLDRVFTTILDKTLEFGRHLAEIGLRALWVALLIVIASSFARRIRRRVRLGLEGRNVKNNVPTLVDNAIKFGVYLVAGSFALGILGANPTSLFTAFGLITAAVSLALQDVLKNVVAGIYLLAEQPFRVGDRLVVTGQEGLVQRIEIRVTVLRNDRAEEVLVPNFKVFTEIVTNRSAYGLRSLTLQLTGLTAPPAQAETAVRSALAGVPDLDESSPRVEFLRMGPDGCDLGVTVWYRFGADPRTALMSALRERFPEATLTATAA